jgi:anti-sigma factor RsiW
MNPKARRFRGSKEMASCMQVMRALQSFLDGQTDDITTRRVANHLDACRRCGLEAATYREIKAALARNAAPVDQRAVERLRAFGARLGHDGERGTDEAPPPA